MILTSRKGVRYNIVLRQPDVALITCMSSFKVQHQAKVKSRRLRMRNNRGWTTEIWLWIDVARYSVSLNGRSIPLGGLTRRARRHEMRTRRMAVLFCTSWQRGSWHWRLERASQRHYMAGHQVIAKAHTRAKRKIITGIQWRGVGASGA